jgi:ribosomal-protein-alanine N-acetyltransferase
VTSNDLDEPGTEIRLIGERTQLRELRPSDGPDLFAIVGDDRVTQFMSFDSRSGEQAQASIDGAIERAKNDPRLEYYFAITRAGDDRLIGTCRLGLAGAHGAAKLGYSIAAEHWGNGYATDAARTILDYGFGSLGLHRVTAAIGPENPASHAVVKRLGFTREGVLREHVFTNGAWRDSVLYSVLAPEWSRRT